MAALSAPVLSFPRHHPNPNPNPNSKPKPTSSTVNNDSDVSTHSLLSLVEQCTALNHLKQIHARIIRAAVQLDPISSSKLVSAAALSEFSSLDYARRVFDQIPNPNRNVFTWNTLIRAYASSPDPAESVAVFIRMLEQCPVPANKFTYPFLVKAASELRASRVGRAFHGMVIKSSMASDVFILNALVHFYGSCGDLDSARLVFDKTPGKDLVSWNSMITALVQGDCPEEAFDLFREMESARIKPNKVTMFGLLSACGKKKDLEFGRWLCLYIQRNAIPVNLNLNNAMLDMYVKCGSLGDAKQLFDEMPEKDVVSWTTMLDGYARSGDCVEAQRAFKAMPRKDIAAWNALISGYEQNGKPKEALAVFHKLQISKSPKPDEVTLVSTLSACAQLGVMDPGKWIHVYVKRQGLKLSRHIGTSLIDMYAKCGDLGKALEVFDSVWGEKDVYVWSAMINCLAIYGHGREAMDMFSKMVECNVKPNAITFTNVLSACSHSGLVEQGKSIFNQMELVYGVVPGVKHYACMVDMLGRAGRLEEALEQIEKMPMSPSVSIWGALLGACKLHGNVELAERACSEMLELDPRNHGAYVLLSNIYAKKDKWDEVSRLRKLMRDNGIKKEPGCSSIEVDGTVHEFLVGDNSHPLSKDIYAKLDEIAAKLKEIGYVSKTSHLLQFVEEDDMKEQALKLHSEKLAISFGLISTSPSQPVRVVKNLRVCGDCHAVAKLVSEIYGREILLRDRFRFHHFKGGKCSCMDYW